LLVQLRVPRIDDWTRLESQRSITIIEPVGGHYRPLKSLVIDNRLPSWSFIITQLRPILIEQVQNQPMALIQSHLSDVLDLGLSFIFTRIMASDEMK